MANLRPALLITLVFLGYLLWVEWQKDYGPQPLSNGGQSSMESAGPGLSNGEDLPGIGEVPQATDGELPTAPVDPSSDATNANQTVGSAELITVVTDVLEVQIDPVGGTVSNARLLEYPVVLDTPEQKVQLLSASLNHYQVAQSGLLSRQPAPNHTSEYAFVAESYVMGAGDDSLAVALDWMDDSGIEVTKTFTFNRGSYDVEVSHNLRNNTDQVWTGSRYEQIQRAITEEEGGGGFNNPERYSFRGFGFYSPEEKLEKIDLEDVPDDPYKAETTNGWLAMIQHYFFTAWIPPEGERNSFTTTAVNAGGQQRAIARAVSQVVNVAPGAEQSFSSELYVGPKLQEILPEIAEGLELTVNYGIFTIFSAPLFWLLSWIHGFVGNWGWAIVLLTVLIKAAFFKLTEAQYRSMARMRNLQPRIEKLKERYGDDKQAMSQAMMQMYKEEKVNPLGGCLPILVQIPIFIALYWVLLESVELRQAPFILWIDNLSVRDPYFILPLLNAAFMIATQRLTPMVGMDPLQKKMMQAMPIVFAFMFAFFPAGLVLYWATNAGLSLAQQWYITRKIAKTA